MVRGSTGRPKRSLGVFEQIGLTAPQSASRLTVDSDALPLCAVAAADVPNGNGPRRGQQQGVLMMAAWAFELGSGPTAASGPRSDLVALKRF